MLNLKDVTRLSIRPDFARRMLPQLTAGSAFIGLLLIIAWGAGLSTSVLHPWDGLWLLLVSGATALAIPRVGKIHRLAAWFIAFVIQPIYYYAIIYGVDEPTMALVIPTLIFASLLTGRGYTLYMIGFGCLFVGLAGIYTQAGWTYSDPLEPLALARWVAFWCGLYILSGWLSLLVSKNLTESLASAAGQAEALSRTAHALSENPSFGSFVQTVVSTLADQLDIRHGTLFLKEEGIVHPHIVIMNGRTYRAQEAENTPHPLPVAQIPLWGDAEVKAKPFALHNPADDARTINKAQLRAEGTKTVLYVPVLMAGEMRALLALNSSKYRHFRHPELTLAEALAGQLALALRLTDLAAEAQQSTLLDERTRMAREIHDTLAQGFTGIVVQLDVADDYLTDGEIDGARSHLDRARHLARESLAEARRSVYALRSTILKDRTLIQALDRMANSLVEGTKLRAHVTQNGVPYSLPDEAERALLRIGQEALTNVLKHAQATQIELCLRYGADSIVLAISDDGQGFTLNGQASGFGLVGMRERAQGVGGKLAIKSQVGRGTTISATIPKEVAHV